MRVRPAVVACAAAVVSFAVSAAFIVLRPDMSRGAAFLFGDESANLLVADALRHGARLYADIAYPYGPLPIALYTAIGAAAGNTPLVYLLSLAVCSAISAAMLTWLIARSARPLITAGMVSVGLVPTVPLPGAPIGGYTSSIYSPVERIALLTALVLWRPLEDRNPWRSLAIGAVLGLTQGIRFGCGAVLLAAIVFVDLARLASRPARTAFVVRNTLMLAGFAGVEALWIAWAFVQLPAPIAREFLWPLQLLETQQSSGAPRWPTWAGWRMGVTQYLMPVCAMGLGAWGLLRWAHRPAAKAGPGGRADGVSAVAFFFYALASVVYFGHEHHFRQFAWILVLGAAPAIVRLRPRAQLGLLVLCAPALWPVASALTHRASGVAIEVPRGYGLVVAPDVVAQLQFLEAYRHRGPVLFVGNGAGWLYGYEVDHVTRHTWFYAPAVVRGFEESTFEHHALTAAAVIRCAGAIDPAAWPLPPAAIAALAARDQLERAGAGCAVWAPRR